MAVTETCYAKADDGVHIAYQVVGQGPFDLIVVPGFISHVELEWEEPALARFLRRLGSFSRVILFDKRGTGMSDRTERLPDMDRRMLDIEAVMGAVGSSQAALFGVSEGGRMQRLASSPGAAIALLTSYIETDVRPALPLVHAPTLVLHRTGDRMVDVRHARFLAEHILGARLVDLEGTDHFWWTEEPDAILDEVEEFLTGMRSPAEPDRILATVLFTDIVDSTPRAAEVGDHRWRLLLDEHDRLATRQVERHRGRLVKATGDGILATFDGPTRAVRCAQAIIDGARGLDLEVRAGLHTGEVELRGDDVAGLGVHIAQRVSGVAAPLEVLVSRTVVDLVVGSGLPFEDRGERVLKGVPGSWPLFALVDAPTGR